MTNPIDVTGLTKVEEYALDVVVAGATSFVEDDLDEDDKLTRDEHTDAVELAYRIIAGIRDNPSVLLELAAAQEPGDG